LRNQNYIFTTEGHPLPIRSTWHEKFLTTHVPSNWTFVKVPFFFLTPYLMGVFGFRNGVEWYGLIHHYLIAYKHMVTLIMRNMFIPPKFIGLLHDGPFHSDEVISQTKHP
jgi:hypothetical protein